MMLKCLCASRATLRLLAKTPRKLWRLSHCFREQAKRRPARAHRVNTLPLNESVGSIHCPFPRRRCYISNLCFYCLKELFAC
ncbi:hypothetical protein BV349_04598 [Pseudomonas syringae pv. actinidiae]|uniref:Uncharacterized protein n=1 Tax=Pseudomonas syringae pv. actinidiae TaxID=103796 RepID=A0AAN4Q005_PSESF|nr:hypothetical protein BV349_04598 [Pseudomonas syringae pv. actinidiae]OSN72823.1 hypothetical protein BV351_04588 [Pseudomonas syringae pv. actinidiae]GBH14501.1 hypothetical protein KPSA3_00392 [Pseudomonas syringae pv. actinidiae]